MTPFNTIRTLFVALLVLLLLTAAPALAQPDDSTTEPPVDADLALTDFPLTPVITVTPQPEATDDLTPTAEPTATDGVIVGATGVPGDGGGGGDVSNLPIDPGVFESGLFEAWRDGQATTSHTYNTIIVALVVLVVIVLGFFTYLNRKSMSDLKNLKTDPLTGGILQTLLAGAATYTQRTRTPVDDYGLLTIARLFGFEGRIEDDGTLTLTRESHEPT